MPISRSAEVRGVRLQQPSGATTYTYDDAGNRTKVVEDNGAGAVTRYYCHDARNQLTAVSTTSATCAANVIETYTYDAAGNRLSDGGRTFAYTSTGQLQSCTGAGCGTPVFDDDGRLTGITTASGAWTYTYDDEGRLTRACQADPCVAGSATIESTYDGEGHRIRIVETPAGLSPTVTTTDFTYEGDRVVRETAVTGATTVTRTFTTDEAGTIVKMTVATTPSAGADDGTYLVTYNGHGDTIGLAEIHPTTGALTQAARMTYSTWGTPTVTSVNGYGTLGFRYLYVGRFDVQWDDFASAGLHYMHARHYSPEFGRFLQPDPSRAEPNLYGYTENNPISRIDPSGLWFIAVGIIARLVAPIVAQTVRSVVMRVLPGVPVVTATKVEIFERLGRKLQQHWWPQGVTVNSSAAAISNAAGSTSRWLPNMTPARFDTIIRGAQFSRVEQIAGRPRIFVGNGGQYNFVTTYTFPFRVGWDAVGKRWTNTVTYTFTNGTLAAYPGRSTLWWEYVRGR